MNCETCHSLLTDFVYDEIDGGIRAEFEAALERCPDCRAELAMLRRTGEVFDSVEALEVPAKLHNDILRAARLAVAETRPERSRWAVFFSSPAFSAALSVALLAGGGTIFYQLTYGGESETASPFVESETAVATADPVDEGPSVLEAEREIADELAPSPEAAEVEAPADELVRAEPPRGEEGRDSLDQLAQNEAPAEQIALSRDAQGPNVGNNLADRLDGEQQPNPNVPMGGSVIGASSSSGGIGDFDASAVQRGGGGRSAFDDSRVGNVAPSAPRPARANPHASGSEDEEESANVEGRIQLPPIETRRQRDSTRRSSDGGDELAAGTRSREDEVSYRELRPEPNDPHAPGSTATINEARGNAPDPVGAAERGPEPEPEPEPEPAPIVAVAAAPSPPPTDAPTSASEAQGFGQAQSGAPYDGALAGLETEETADQEEPGEDYAPAYEGVDDYGGDAAADEVYLAEAEQTGSDRLRESENSDDSEFDSGLGHYDSGRYGRASRALGRFLDDSAASDPRRAEARYLLGAALYQQGEYRLAEIELDQFLSANPGHRYAEQAGVLLDDMATRNSPTNRRNAPSEATDLMEAQ